jgi:hypothetical protein
MAKWLLKCPHCNHKFDHVRINDTTVQKAYVASSGADAKPDLGEKKLPCPFCQRESPYGRFHLICEDDPDEAAKGKSA